jgi:hypothetical protein
MSKATLVPARRGILELVPVRDVVLRQVGVEALPHPSKGRPPWPPAATAPNGPSSGKLITLGGYAGGAPA